MSGNTTVLHEASFVDDLVMPVISDAGKIVAKTVAVARVAINVFMVYGILLNFLQGKSEAVVCFCGDGSKTAKRKLDSLGNTIEIEPGTNLRFVQVYKHVGSKYAVCANLCEEVTFRYACMMAGSHRLRKGILNNKRLCIKKTYVHYASIPVHKRHLQLLHLVRTPPDPIQAIPQRDNVIVSGRLWHALRVQHYW